MLPLAAYAVKYAVVMVVVAVEADIYVVVVFLLEADINAARHWQSPFKWISAVYVESLKLRKSYLLIEINQSPRATPVVIPHRHAEAHRRVLPLTGAVKIEPHAKKSVGLMQVVSASQEHVAARRGQAVAILGSAVVVGVIVVKHLSEHHRIVVTVVIARHAFLHNVYHTISPTCAFGIGKRDTRTSVV